MAGQTVKGEGQAQAATFLDQLQSALRGFRAAMIDLLAAVGGDPTKPQDLARQFGLSRNLTWKISKVVNAADPVSAVPHIPGAAGLRIFFRSLGDAGAPRHLVEEAQRAADEFDRVVKVHTGDRNTLEIMVSSMLPAAAQGEQIEQSRKLAYQGNSGTWGVRAKAQIALNVLAPNAADPDQADLVQVGGLVGFRRLRSDARWLLFRRERWSDDAASLGQDVRESLDPDHPVDRGVPLLGDYCSKPIPDIDFVAGGDEEQYELPAGPVGNTAALTCIYGQVTRKVGAAYAEGPGEYSEIGCNLITPAEHLVLDLLVHRDYDWAMNPELLVLSRLDGGAMGMGSRRERNVLAVAETIADLGWGAAAVATPLVPRYAQLVRDVFDRVGWSTDDFRAFRFSMSYPPIPTAVLMRSLLPVRKA
jgi:hypothetical protein